MGTYTTARICRNGHLISKDSNSSDSRRFCPQCGAPTIIQCENCGAHIHGTYQVPGIVCIGESYTIPAYCYCCGSPYPWTQNALETAKAIIHEDEQLNEEQMKQFYACIPDLITTTPKTTLALIRFKKFVDKATTSTGKALCDILKDVAAEAVKKALFEN